MDPIEQLSRFFAQFPGTGPRQASRFVYFLLSRGKEYRKELTEALSSLERDVRQCKSCRRYFRPRGSETECSICSDSSRDRTLLAIVPHDRDLSQIEKSGQFNGMYFVLGGIVPLLDKNPSEKIRQRELLEEVSIRIKEGLREIIIATNANPDGEHTAEYVYGILSPLLVETGITVTTFGRGFSTGTEIEYSDTDTIKNALKHRIPLD